MKNIANREERKFAPLTSEQAAAFVRKLLAFSGMDYQGELDDQTIDGFTVAQISNMISRPASYSSQLVSLSNYMYRNYGYYQRLANYYIDMAQCNWTADTEVFDPEFYEIDAEELRRNYLGFCAQIAKYNLQSEMPRMMKRVFLEDACFGYIVEGASDCFVYYLPTDRCAIKTITDGIYGYGIRASAFSTKQLENLPKEIQSLINQAKSSRSTYAIVPPEKSICLKYNDQVTYLYPPLFSLISSVMDIQDYKSLAKQKAENDNYNLIGLGIPTDPNDDDHLKLSDDIVVPFTQMVKRILPDNFGVIPHPFELQSYQFKSNNTDRDNVEDAIAHFYDEAGVSRDLLASSSSGSELKISIENDASDLYRIYRQLEQSINLKMKILGFVYSTHRFVFQIMDVNIHNLSDKINAELKYCEASLPNKTRLCALQGINPSRMLGNDYMENAVLNLGESWTVLKSSHTSASKDDAGRPEMEDTSLSPSGEKTRESGANDASNRI